MTDEPLDDWDHARRASDHAFRRGAIHTVMWDVVIPLGFASAANTISMTVAIWGIPTLPAAGAPYAVLYLIAISSLVAAQFTVSIIKTKLKAPLRGDPGARAPISSAARWRRRAVGRIVALPLAYLVFHALGFTVAAAVIAGLLWITPMAVAVLNNDADIERRLRALNGFMNNPRQNGSES